MISGYDYDYDYWRGNCRFYMRDGVEYMVIATGREVRTDKHPRGKCD